MFNEVFLIGNRFLVYAQPNVLTKHLSDVINLRKRIKQLQYAARYMDDVGVSVSDAKVRVKRFVLDEPDQKVTLLTITTTKAWWVQTSRWSSTRSGRSVKRPSR
jgi:hypothetical protein